MRCPQCGMGDMKCFNDGVKENGVRFSDYICRVCLTSNTIDVVDGQIVAEHSTPRYCYLIRSDDRLKDDMKVFYKGEEK